MKKFILGIALVAMVAIAGQLTYTTEQTEQAVGIALALGGTTTTNTLYVTSIVFTNGWSIDAVSTGIVFNAP